MIITTSNYHGATSPPAAMCCLCCCKLKLLYRSTSAIVPVKALVSELFRLPSSSKLHTTLQRKTGAESQQATQNGVILPGTTTNNSVAPHTQLSTTAVQLRACPCMGSALSKQGLLGLHAFTKSLSSQATANMGARQARKRVFMRWRLMVASKSLPSSSLLVKTGRPLQRTDGRNSRGNSTRQHKECEWNRHAVGTSCPVLASGGHWMVS